MIDDHIIYTTMFYLLYIYKLLYIYTIIVYMYIPFYVYSIYYFKIEYTIFNFIIYLLKIKN